MFCGNISSGYSTACRLFFDLIFRVIYDKIISEKSSVKKDV